jgi:hypothetical protein
LFPKLRWEQLGLAFRKSRTCKAVPLVRSSHDAKNPAVPRRRCSCCPVYGWSESGHHLIALLAFDHLTPHEQKELLDMLAAHPRHVEDFTPPSKVRNVDRFRIGTAGYWPDIARSQPEYNRPSCTISLAFPSRWGILPNTLSLRLSARAPRVPICVLRTCTYSTGGGAKPPSHDRYQFASE